MPAEKIAFMLFDGAGAPKADASPTFSVYRDRGGVSRPAPTITNLGAGLYGFTASEADVAAATAFLISAGAGAYAGSGGTRVFGAVSLRDLPWVVQLFEDAAGALWSGAAPTLGAWRDFSGGADASVPAIALIATGLYGFSPTAQEVREGRAFRWDAPAGAYPTNPHGSTHFGAADVPDLVLELLRDVLLGEETVTDLLGTRLYPNKLPQKPTLPAVVYSIVSEVPVHVLDGGGYQVSGSRVQFDCYAKKYADARAAWSVIEVVLRTIATEHPSSGLEAWLEDARDLYDDTAELHRVSADVRVWRKQE